MSTSKKQVHAILPQIPPTGDKLFRVLLEKSKDAVALLSRERTLLYISPAIEQLL